jgi:NADPH2:quinone reductase
LSAFKHQSSEVIVMRVVRATRFGGPEVLEPGEAPDPKPGPGEMIVDVAVAEVLFLDTQLRGGWEREYFELELPFVLGEGVAGVVVAVGATSMTAGSAGP